MASEQGKSSAVNTDNQHGPSFSVEPGIIAIMAISAVWIVLALVLVAPAGFSLDDFIYQAMIDAFAKNGSLFVENGYAEHRVDALRNHLLRDVGGELAPQYPGGWGIVAAPAYLIAGLTGVITINAIACAITLWLVWQTAWSMFQDRRLATYAALFFGLSSFAVDYALAIWPHGIAMFCVAAAMAAITKDLRKTSVQQVKWLFLAGLFLGMGLNFRVDVLFVAAPIAVWLLGSSDSPYRSTMIFFAGLLPGLALSTTINWLKFGIASPLTYGDAGGGTAFGYYAQLAPVLLAGISGAIALGSTRIRTLMYQPKAMALLSIAGIMLIVFIPALRDLALRVLQGFWILVVDFQALPAPAHGLAEMEDGTFRMFGLIKKALLQSMPYLAIVILLIPRMVYGPDRSALTLCFLIFGISALPFAYASWHGGQANNMRYFANLVPALVILAAAAFRQVEAMMNGRSTITILGVICLVGLAVAWPLFKGYNADFIAQNRLPNALAAALVLSCIVFLVVKGNVRKTAARVIHGLTIAGLLTAAISAWVFDLKLNLSERSINHRISILTADLPPDALVITNVPVRLAFRVNRPPAMTARVSARDTQIDPSLAVLVTSRLNDGKSVFVQGRTLADQFAASGIGDPGPARYDIPPSVDIFKLTPTAR